MVHYLSQSYLTATAVAVVKAVATLVKNAAATAVEQLKLNCFKSDVNAIDCLVGGVAIAVAKPLLSFRQLFLIKPWSKLC